MNLFDLPKDIVFVIKSYLESVDMFQMTLVCKKGQEWKCESKIDLFSEFKSENESMILTTVTQQEGRIKFRIEEKFRVGREVIEIGKKNERSFDIIVYLEYCILKSRMYITPKEISTINLKLLLIAFLEAEMKSQSSDEALRWTLNGLSKNSKEEKKKDLLYMIWKELKIPNPACITLSPIAFSFMRHCEITDDIGFAANYYAKVCSVSEMIKMGMIHNSDHTNKNVAVFYVEKAIPKEMEMTNDMLLKILGLMIGDKILMKSFLKQFTRIPIK